MLGLADRMLGYDRLSEAYRYVLLAEAVGGFDSSMRSRIKRTAAEVKSAADKLIEEADQHCTEGQYAEAVDKYSRVSGLRKMGSSKVARRKLIDLQDNPAVRASLREIKASQRLERVLDMIDITSMDIEIVVDDTQADCGSTDASGVKATAAAMTVEAPAPPAGGPDYAVFPPPDMTMTMPGEESVDSGDDMAGMDMTEVEVSLLLNLCDRIKFIDSLDSFTDHYGETASGRDALDLIDQLHASAEFMDGLEEHRREEQAMECVSMAQQYEQIGKIDVAIKMYTEAVEISPESEWGVAAKTALTGLNQ
jgi:tetratricopeptide (TPR) repeat protein